MDKSHFEMGEDGEDFLELLHWFSTKLIEKLIGNFFSNHFYEKVQKFEGRDFSSIKIQRTSLCVQVDKPQKS